MSATFPGPTDFWVPCPHCGAAIGEICRGVVPDSPIIKLDGGRYGWVHRERFDDFRRNQQMGVQ